MAGNFRLADATANAAAGDGTNAGIRAYAGSNCQILFYTGSQAGTVVAPTGPLGGVSTVTFGAASSPVGKIDCPSGITSGTASASGTALSFLLTKSNGTTPVADGNVSNTGADINFGSSPYNVFVSGGTIAMTSFSITVPTGV